MGGCVAKKRTPDSIGWRFCYFYIVNSYEVFCWKNPELDEINEHHLVDCNSEGRSEAHPRIVVRITAIMGVSALCSDAPGALHSRFHSCLLADFLRFHQVQGKSNRAHS